MADQKPAMERYLAIPELVGNMIGALPPSELPSAACVCRAWEAHAIPALWRDDPPLKSLLILLLPPGSSDLLSGENDYPDIAALEDLIPQWPRFVRYESLIRSLRVVIAGDYYDTHDRIPSATLMDLLTLAEVMGYQVFTRLKILTLDVADDEENTLRAAVRLLPKGLEDLSLTWKEMTGRSVLPMLVCIKSQLASLHRIRVDIQTDKAIKSSLISAIVPILSNILRNSPRLVEVQFLSPLILHPEIWRLLQSHPSLEVIDLYLGPLYCPPSPSRIQFMDGFEELQSLTIEIAWDDVSSFFSSSPKRPKLNTLRLLICNAVPTNSFKNIVEVVASVATGISDIELAVSGAGPWVRLEDVLSFDAFSKLNSLSIRTDMPALLTDDDYATLGKHFPNLTKLKISPDPISCIGSSDTPLGTIRALSALAAHCRRLIEVHVCLDATKDQLPDRTFPLNTFSEDLELLNFGLSRADAPNAVGCCLARVLRTSRTRIMSSKGGQYGRCNMPSTLMTGFELSKQVWEQVAEEVTNVHLWIGHPVEFAEERSNSNDRHRKFEWYEWLFILIVC